MSSPGNANPAAYGGFTSPALPAGAPVQRTPALLVLEDGYTLVGSSYGALGSTVAKIVFNTGMTGYQETLTDSSYHRQIVVMTSPHIGNTGINDEDGESDGIRVAGFVVRDPARRASSWRARRDLESELASHGVVGICDLDTRALTRHLRERGTMRAGIFSGAALPDGVGYAPQSAPAAAAIARCLEAVRAEPAMTGQDPVAVVASAAPTTAEENA